MCNCEEHLRALKDDFDKLKDGFDRLEKLLRCPEQAYLSIEDAAALTGLSEKHIRRAVHGGMMVASQVGTADRPLYRVSLENVHRWMKEREAGPRPPAGRAGLKNKRA